MRIVVMDLSVGSTLVVVGGFRLKLVDSRSTLYTNDIDDALKREHLAIFIR